MALVAVLSVVSAYGGVIQIGDFRIGSTDYTADTYFDPAITNGTRSVIGAPVQVNSTFTATTQTPGGTPDSATDMGIRTWSSSLTLINMQRYAASTDGGATGAARIGVAQWNFNLSPLDSYLSNNSLGLTALDLDLVLDLPGGDGYEVFLSYTDAGAGTTLTSTSGTDARHNYDLWWAAESVSATAGTIVNGQFEVLAMNQVLDGTISDSIMALYGNGVREFNLMLMTPDYNAAQQTKILDGSGLSITTEVIPEPATIGMLGLGALMTLIIRRIRGS